MEDTHEKFRGKDLGMQEMQDNPCDFRIEEAIFAGEWLESSLANAINLELHGRQEEAKQSLAIALYAEDWLRREGWA